MLFNFIKSAFRNIKKQKIYFLINLVGLALGISASVLIALFVADELSYDQFHKNADKIVRVTYGLDSPSGNYNFARTAPLYGPTLKDKYPEVEFLNRFKLANPILKYKNQVNETDKYLQTKMYLRFLVLSLFMAIRIRLSKKLIQLYFQKPNQKNYSGMKIQLGKL